MGVDGGIPATPDNLLHMYRQLPPHATLSVAGIGRWQLGMTTMAIILGGHVRVGLEDNIYYTKGFLAPNEDFVTRTRRLAEELQREIATPEEARKILGLRLKPR
jgi:3-keto-5-aminohexanoate cleavage enzyme